MFPEGHRQRAGSLGDIQSGVALFSLREGVVTIPMVLDGTERVVRKRGCCDFRGCAVTFGPPLELPDADLPHAQRADWSPADASDTKRSQDSARLDCRRRAVSTLEVRISECAGLLLGGGAALELALKAAARRRRARSTRLGRSSTTRESSPTSRSGGSGVISDPDEAREGTVILRSHGVPREVRRSSLSGRPSPSLDATCRS